MKNNINLDELFSKAREAEPVFSKDDASSLIENAPIASTGSLINKKLIGSPIMNIITAAVITAIAVGAITYNSMTDIQPNIQRKSVQVLQKDAKDSKLNPNPTVAEVVNSSEQMDKMNDKHESEITKVDKVFANDVIQGVNIIELTEEQAKNIGITIGNDADCIEYISGSFDVNPQLVKIYVDWRVSTNSLNSNQLPKGKNIFEPRMVTDNFGNKRISTFNDDETSNLAKLEFMDKDKNLYIQSISADENVVITNSNFFYTPQNTNNSSMSFTTVIDVDSVLSNLNIDEIIKNSIANFDEIRDKLPIPDSLKNKAMEQIIPMFADSSKKYMNQLSKKYDIQLKIDGDISDEMRIKLEEMQEKLKTTNMDSLIKSNFISNYNGKLNNNLTFADSEGVATDKDFKLNNAQIKIIKNLTDNPNMKIDDFKINSTSISDEQIKLNKLVPVAIVIPNAKDRKGNELKNFRFVLWFEPTDEFVEKLPENIKKQLQRELKTINNSADICENKDVVAGQETYLDVWRACSGAIENLTTYPNPVENIINVKFKLNEKRTVSFSIHDLNGRKVQELGKVSLTNGTIERSFAINNLESGMYLIVAQSEVGEQAVQRIIVR